MNTQETITEYKLYVLNLAPMRGGVDKSQPVAVFDELDKLKDYYNGQLAEEPYIDDPSEDNYGNICKWHKVFKKGSPLEWYNPADSLEPSTDIAFGGVWEAWQEEYPDQSNIRVPFNPV